MPGHPHYSLFPSYREDETRDAIINWLLENTTGDYFYDLESQKTGRKVKGREETIITVVFYFEKHEDAFMFKLLWG